MTRVSTLRPPSIYDHEYSPTREAAMAEFEAAMAEFKEQRIGGE
jgi:hypothetical protein